MHVPARAIFGGFRTPDSSTARLARFRSARIYGRVAAVSKQRVASSGSQLIQDKERNWCHMSVPEKSRQRSGSTSQNERGEVSELPLGSGGVQRGLQHLIASPAFSDQQIVMLHWVIVLAPEVNFDRAVIAGVDQLAN